MKEKRISLSVLISCVIITAALTAGLILCLVPNPLRGRLTKVSIQRKTACGRPQAVYFLYILLLILQTVDITAGGDGGHGAVTGGGGDLTHLLAAAIARHKHAGGGGEAVLPRVDIAAVVQSGEIGKALSRWRRTGRRWPGRRCDRPPRDAG